MLSPTMVLAEARVDRDRLHQSQDRPMMATTDGAAAHVLANSAPHNPGAECACARAC